MGSGRLTSVPARNGVKPHAGQARGFAESDSLGRFVASSTTWLDCKNETASRSDRMLKGRTQDRATDVQRRCRRGFHAIPCDCYPTGCRPGRRLQRARLDFPRCPLLLGEGWCRWQSSGASFCHRLFMRPLESCFDMRPTPVQARARRCRLRLAAVAGPMVTTLAITAAGCASAKGAPTPNEVDAAIRARTAEAGIHIEAQGPLPPDVDPTDGVTQEEAVAIALWNSPSFQATLTDLGIARADLVEAGLLRNPIFSLLFPLGPKRLEVTLQYPFEALFQRPPASPRRNSTRRRSASASCGTRFDGRPGEDGARRCHHRQSAARARNRERHVDATAGGHHRRPSSGRRYQRARRTGAENRCLAIRHRSPDRAARSGSRPSHAGGVARTRPGPTAPAAALGGLRCGGVPGR